MHHSIVKALSLPLLASAALAQTASYTLFGDGCNGAPATSCLSLNDANPVMTVSSLPNEYAYPVVNTSGQAITIVGFEIFTTTNTGIPETVKTGLLYDLSGPLATSHSQPDLVNCADGQITVLPIQGWYSTSVYPPITIPAGGAFWFHVDAYSRVAPPQHSTVGGVAGPTTNWWRRPGFNNFVWTSSVSVARQIFRIRCLPDAPTVPTLMATSLPQLGGSLSLQIAGGLPWSPAFLVWAFDRTQWLSFPTPVHLDLFGAPNCYNYTSADTAGFVLLDQSGVAATSLSIPNSPGFAGLTWHNQVAVLAPAVNALDMLFTNAGTAVVGN